MAKQAMTDAERILRRKRVEQEWANSWRGRLSDPAALKALWFALYFRGCISKEDFRRFKAEHGYEDKQSDI